MSPWCWTQILPIYHRWLTPLLSYISASWQQCNLSVRPLPRISLSPPPPLMHLFSNLPRLRKSFYCFFKSNNSHCLECAVYFDAVVLIRCINTTFQLILLNNVILPTKWCFSEFIYLLKFKFVYWKCRSWYFMISAIPIYGIYAILNLSYE